MTKPIVVPTFMYHPAKGKRLFNLDPETYEDDVEALEKDGWKDTPKGMKTEKPAEKEPDGPVELTKEQEELLAQFVKDPSELGKEQLLSLGAAFNLKLLKAWKEETLIKKIQDAL